MKKIQITEFAKRHFKKDFGGTKITDISSEEFIESLGFIKEIRDETHYSVINPSVVLWYIRPGDFEFSKLITINNPTNATVSCMKISLENAIYLRSDYSSRVESELPVLSRWFDFPPPIKSKVADYLTIVLYSKKQLNKEGVIDFDAEYGVVALLAHDSFEPEPISPITMMRNSIGIEEGGNGVKIDKDKYLKSVAFWKEHALVK